MTEPMNDEPGRWQTFGERTIYASPWVRRGPVDVGLPDGGRYWHHVVRLPRTQLALLRQLLLTAGPGQ